MYRWCTSDTAVTNAARRKTPTATPKNIEIIGPGNGARICEASHNDLARNSLWFARSCRGQRDPADLRAWTLDLDSICDGTEILLP
jgi:hypothetical protein